MSAYVIGHKNPDTDAICSAIGYADFLQQTGSNEFQAARCGEVTARTALILEKAGIEHPLLVMDVRPHVGQICERDVIVAHSDETLMEAFDRMRRSNHRSMPVVDSDRKIAGMLSMQKMVDLLLPSIENVESARQVQTSLNQICRTLKGEFQNAVDIDREQNFLIVVGAVSADVFNERLKHYDPSHLIIVVGNRPTVQLPSIEYGARAILVTRQKALSSTLLQRAQEKNVAVIVSPWDTATSTLLLRCAMPVRLATRKIQMTFAETDLIHDIQGMVQNLTEVLFTIVGEDKRLAGVFSKSDLLKPKLVKLVLVDHNEYGQAVTGADQAEILQVIDHHRLGGGLTSHEPIRFINEPLGSTSTIVAKEFKSANLKPSRGIAMCLMGGIIADTLHLTSPTTTPVDVEILNWLKTISDYDPSKMAEEYFSAGSVLQVSSADQAVRSDCKDFTENGWRLVIAQVEEQGFDHFMKHKKALREALEEMRQSKNIDFACLLVTDVTLHNSLLLTAGDERIIHAIDYPKVEDHLFELEDVVSRKKQLLPHLSRILSKLKRDL
jgi:manganese-dependent inorganic pyrophosphatase